MSVSRRALGAIACLAVLVAACSDKDIDPPAELTDFQSTAKIQKVWSADVGGDARLRLGLGIAVDGDLLFTANRKGEVIAMAAATGKRAWRANTKLPISAGPGAGAGLVVVGSTYGDLVALDAATGDVKWKAHVNSEILSAPAISASVVLLRAGDGRVLGLRTSDGTELWSAEQQVPRLSLRGTSQPVIAGDLGVSGFDNGRVMALSLSDGSTLWDVAVAPPAGRTEIDRMIDIDAAVQVADDDIYAVTFHGKAARIARNSGAVQWARDISSYSGFALDDDGFYITSADGELIKLGRRTGVETWKQAVLSRRRLSAPAVLDSLVAVADLEGYVHFFDKATGELAARVHPLGERVSAAPIVSNSMLFMMDAGGKIAALRVATPRN